ncbi:MAG: S1 RNA-binding domain-containing protein [Sedimenticolaceae bacterium]
MRTPPTRISTVLTMSNSENFEDLLAQFDESQPARKQTEPDVGDRVQGTIVSIGEEHAYIDLGFKSEGVMDIDVLKNEAGELTAKIGDKVEAAVTSKDKETGALILGTQQGLKAHDLSGLQDAYSQGLPVAGLVTGVTKGGVEVQIAGQRAFCPASQIDINFVEDLSELTGQRLDFRIMKIEGGRRPNLVLSRRAILEEEQRERAVQIRASLEVGATLTGKVTSLQDYGAFVDLGGIEGMIHISELSFARLAHPNEMLHEGQELEVAVLRIEKTDNPKRPEKIALSLRSLAKDPWQEASAAYAVGTRVSGTISRVEPFGAFVELTPGIDGLVHISELAADKRVNHPSEVVKIGDKVEATVLGVDIEKRRISLSLDENKAAEAGVNIEQYKQKPKEEGAMGSFGELLQQSMKKQK